MKLTTDFAGNVTLKGPFELNLDSNTYIWRLNTAQAGDLLLEDTEKFTLRYQYFKGAQNIRIGPSSQWWSIYIPKDGGFAWIKCLDNPLQNTQVTARTLDEPYKDADTVDGELAPGTPLNPTKNTKSWIETVDSGRVIILEDSPLVKKFEFQGSKLKGVWLLSREEGTSVWLFQKTETPQSSKTAENTPN